MDRKVVMLVKESCVSDIVSEFGEDFDFDGLGIMLRVLSDKRFDEYIISVDDWENESIENLDVE